MNGCCKSKAQHLVLYGKKNKKQTKKNCCKDTLPVMVSAWQRHTVENGHCVSSKHWGKKYFVSSPGNWLWLGIHDGLVFTS